jgi:hypothetical protein
MLRKEDGHKLQKVVLELNLTEARAFLAKLKEIEKVRYYYGS